MKKNIVFSSVPLFVILLFLIVTGCDNDGISEDQAQIEYNRRDQLRNLFTNGILPLHEEFVQQTEVLFRVTEAFSNDISLENLLTLREEWKTTANLWKRCEVYDIGDIKDSFIHTRINTWPTNTDNIESFIGASDPINLNFINSVGSSSKGIAALEYLLFDKDATTTLSDLQSNSRRIDYLVALSEDLKNTSEEIKGLWNAYGPVLTEAVQSDLDGGQNQTVNAMVTLLEEIIISKLGRALGDANGGFTDIEELEAFRSDISLEMIQNNVEELRRAFNGSYKENTRRIGFDDYLVNLDNIQLRDAIKAAFNTVEEHISTFGNSLNNILQTDPEKVLELKNACNELLVLIKVDMASFIGSTITFNDNDGD